ncbi:hypothetical protein DRW07_01805 [Alteromonas sediminis]|uniref:PEGA domain-containing protein n=1 Tax=Alteromonas sediminis TaxID=2259342 RepID=A0A3N5ZDH9_9ALTE|nr:hypothetical protein [Alteromonas sediminis]RPJ68168.1 hypothetical protein DRW07_01805 [Alteromonas sediminis]
MSQQSLDQQLAEQQRRLRLRRRNRLALVCLAVTGLAVAVFASQLLFTEGQSAGQFAREPVLTAEQKEKSRDAFMQSLLEFEQSRESMLAESHIQSFDRDEYNRIKNTKEAALAAFARGEFKVANRAIDEADSKAQAYLSQWETAFESLYRDAAQAFVNGDIDTAQFAYQQARQRNPGSEKLKALGRRIFAYDQVEQLLAQYRAAIAENNTGKQIQLLTRALQLDPARVELQPLIDELTAAERTDKVAALVEEGNKALANNQLERARQHLSQASTLDSKDAGVRAAMQALEQRTKTDQLFQLLAELDVNVNADDWQAVSTLAKSALTTYPNNKALKQLASTANDIVAKSAEFKGFMARSTAFYDSGFRQRVRQALMSNEHLLSHSAMLAGQAEAIRDKLKKMETPVMVTLTSDGKTHVTIFKEASLGKFERTDKTMLPGTYRVEGRCDGYQTIQKDLRVEATSDPIMLHIACEKRI